MTVVPWSVLDVVPTKWFWDIGVWVVRGPFAGESGRVASVDFEDHVVTYDRNTVGFRTIEEARNAAPEGE